MDPILSDLFTLKGVIMKLFKRKPIHPGYILEEHYIKQLDLNLHELANHLGISRNTLFKIRIGKASITPSIALL